MSKTIIKTSKKPEKSQQQPAKNWIAIASLAALGLNGFNLLLLLLLYGNYSRLAAKPPPSLVQLSNGQAINVSAIGNSERSAETIARFTLDIFSSMMTWTGRLKDSDNNRVVEDPGVIIKELGNKKIATAAWESSLALSSDFHEQFLIYLADITPNQVFDDKINIIFVPGVPQEEIQQPIQLKEGHWQVNLVAQLLVIRNKRIERRIPFNKKIFLRAVIPPTYLTVPRNQSVESGSKGFSPKDNYRKNYTAAQKEVAQIIAQIRQAGLEIYRIEDLEL